jgi:hypothetical protein
MKFYYFGGVFNDTNSLETASKLEEHNFDGVMYTYDSTQGDMFVRVAKDIDTKEKIKYLVAIRPYTISPQYLYTINDSITEIMKDRLQINFITGYIKDHESNVGGVLGDVNDESNSVQRSNYMIDFIKKLNEMSESRGSKPLLDFYVSTTNSYVFDTVKKYKNKIILPYHIYKRGFWSDSLKDTSLKVDLKLNDVEVMVAMTPIIRKNEEEFSSLKNYAIRPIWKKGEASKVLDDVEYFTHESFNNFVEMLEKDGINYLLINAVPRKESEIIIPFIKQYSESRNRAGLKE